MWCTCQRDAHTIARDVVGGRRDRLHQVGADVLELVLELYGLGHRDTVLGDLGAAVALLDHDVAALGLPHSPASAGMLRARALQCYAVEV